MTIEDDMAELLDELFPLPNRTEQLRAAAWRGIESKAAEQSINIEAENVQVIEYNDGEVRQDNG